MAAAAPAVVIVPFAYLLKGDSKIAVLSEVASYIASLAYTPLLILVLLGVSVDLGEVVKLLVILIIAPLILSRIISRLDSRLFNRSKEAVNLCFFVLSYSIIGLNQHALVYDTLALVPVFIVLFLRTYGTATLTYLLLKKSVKKERNIVYALFASYKNGGATAAMALLLFGADAALPAGVASIFELSFIIYLEKVLLKAKD